MVVFYYIQGNDSFSADFICHNCVGSKICTAQNTYYASSSTDSACQLTTCLNFFQYIENSETYFTSNTTFIFSPGDHIVETNVAIVNVNALKLIGSNFLGGRKTQILCTLPAKC